MKSVYPPLVVGGVLAIYAFGVGYDMAKAAGVAPDDGMDHTPSVVLTTGLSTSATATTIIIFNTVTGDEVSSAGALAAVEWTQK